MTYFDLAGDTNNPIDELDVACTSCIHCRKGVEGNWCSFYSFRKNPDPITGEFFGGVVFCYFARTQKGPCGRVAFGYDDGKVSGVW